jgi:regulatory protein
MSNRDAPPEDEQALGPPGDPETVARTICLRLLERRACTRRELADALSRRGVPEEPARRVLDRFTEVGLIDDEALAANFAAAVHRERGLAGRAVAAKLRRRGVDDEVVRSVVAQIEPGSERERAEQLVQARLRSLHGADPAARARRLIGLLARKGYSPEVAHQVVREAVRNLDGNDLGLLD